MSITSKILGENLSRLLGFGNSEEFKRIKVNQNILSIRDNRIIPIDNIARITSREIRVPWLVRIGIFFMTMMIFSITILISLIPPSYNSDSSSVFQFLFGLVSFVLAAILVWTFIYVTYGVKIEPSGQLPDLLITPNQDQADQLFKALSFAVKDGGRQHSIVVTNESGTVTIVKGDHVIGDQIKDINKSSIASKSNLTTTNTI